MKRLDLRKDFGEVSAFLAKRAKSFDPATNSGPGKGKRVSRIDFGFDVCESGWACLVFDTRRKPDPDGEWNEFIEDTVIERPKWSKAYESVEEEPLELVLPDSSRKSLSAGDTGGLVKIIGELLRDVLIQARQDGLFSGLPKTPGCELGVEEQDGSYGWPRNKDRRKQNLAEPVAAAVTAANG